MENRRLKSLVSPLIRFWTWWFTIRSNDPTVAYRERALRFLLPIFTLVRPYALINAHYLTHSDSPRLLPFWVTIQFWAIPLILSFYFLSKNRIGLSGAFFLLNWYLADMANLPSDGYWYPGIQVSFVMQIILAAVLLPSDKIVPFTVFHLASVGAWSGWLDANFYDPPLLSTGEPATVFSRAILTLGIQEFIVMILVRYMRLEMEKSLQAQQTNIRQLEKEINERHTAQLALRESEARYRHLLENIPAITYIIGIGPEPPHRTIYVSPQIEKVSGFNSQDFLKNESLWYELIHPDDRERAIAESEQADSTGSAFSCDYRIVSTDQRIFWVHDESVLVKDENGRPLYRLGVWTDISDRKYVEMQAHQRAEQLATIVEIGHAVTTLQDLDNVLEIIRKQIQHIAPADAIFISLLKEDKKHLTFPLTYDMGVRYNQADAALTPGTPLAHVIETGETFRIHRTPEEIAALEAIPGDVGNPQLRSKSLLYVPLWGADQIVGAMSIQSYSFNSYPDELVETVAAIGDQVAIAIQNSRLYTDVQTELAERKLAENKLRSSETLYRRAIDAAGAVPYYRDFNTNTYTFMGEGILQMTGYSAAEMTPQIWESLELEGFPRGKLAGLTYEEADQLTEQDQSILWECDYLIRTRSGQQRWVADTSVVGLDANGVQAGVVGILQDITERKLAQQKIAQTAQQLAMLNEIGRAVSEVTDLETVLEIIRQQLEKVVKFDFYSVRVFNETERTVTHLAVYENGRYWPEPDMPITPDTHAWKVFETGESILHLLTEQEIEEYQHSNYPQVGARAEMTTSLIFAPLKKHGKTIGALSVQRYQQNAYTLEDLALVEAVAIPVSIAIENARLFTSLQDELAERKRAEAQIRELNADLERRVQERTAELAAINRELESFSYSVSHDLRAPLRAMTSFSHILKEDYQSVLDEDGLAHLERIIGSGKKMNLLIDDLLSLSRLGHKPMNLQEVDLDNLVRASIETLAHQAAGRQIEWVLADLGIAIADPTLLQQVYANLIENAIKYTGKRELARIEIGCLEQNGSKKVYFVRDNGAGFDMKYANKLFGVFQRLHRDEDFQGTGIGLATVQRIIHRHGGRIWAEAEPGKGATFYFTIG
jgi:PAS domain S-box-containing protein